MNIQNETDRETILTFLSDHCSIKLVLEVRSIFKEYDKLKDELEKGCNLEKYLECRKFLCAELDKLVSYVGISHGNNTIH